MAVPAEWGVSRANLSWQVCASSQSCAPTVQGLASSPSLSTPAFCPRAPFIGCLIVRKMLALTWQAGVNTG